MATQPTATTLSGSAQVIRMSLRPPSRFSPGGDLDLWLKRFEKYLKQTKIAEDRWTSVNFCLSSMTSPLEKSLNKALLIHLTIKLL